MIVRENIEFKRGQDSKRGLDVGADRSETRIIQRFLELTEPMFLEDAYNWISVCPPLMKDLGVTTVEDMEDLVSFETDYTAEQNDIDSDEIHDNYNPGRIKKSYTPSGKFQAGWRWNIGSLDDGSKVIHYDVGMTDGYVARKEWIK